MRSLENRGNHKSSIETVLSLARKGGVGKKKGAGLKQPAPYEGRGCQKKENCLRQEASINTIQLAGGGVENFRIETRAGV